MRMTELVIAFLIFLIFVNVAFVVVGYVYVGVTMMTVINLAAAVVCLFVVLKEFKNV